MKTRKTPPPPPTPEDLSHQREEFEATIAPKPASQDDIPCVYKSNELPSKFETWNDLMDFIEYHKEHKGKQHEACIVECEIARNFIHAKCLEELRKVRKSLTISPDKASKLTFALHRLNAEFAGFDLIEVRNALFELIRVNSKP